MGTKWKRSKAVLGFLSFAVGVSLLLTSLLPLASNLTSDGGRRSLKEALKTDFQDTAAFRNYLSELMNQFIAMGVGGPLDRNYGYSYYDDTVVMEGVAVTSVAVDGDWGWYDWDETVPTQSDKERWKKQAESWNERHQVDKSILYYITVDSQVLYTNMERRGARIPTFPDTGYRFRLSFNGTKCEAAKNEVKLDLYGDGIYEEDADQWVLPGYTNFQAGDNAKRVCVFVAVADQPALYIQGDYGSSAAKYQDNRLYWLEREWSQGRQELLVEGTIKLGVSLLLLAVWFLLRKDKAVADRAMAGVTGHIWFEFKVLALLAAVVLLLLPLTAEMRHILAEVKYAYSDGGYTWEPWFLQEYWREVFSRPALVLAAFWTGYLFANDLRYNQKSWRHGLCGILRAKELKLPIQKRLSRRSVVLTVVLLVLGGYIALYIPVLNFGFSSGVKFFLPPILALLIGLTLAIGPGQRRLWSDLGCLTDQITAVHNGNFTSPTLLPSDSDLGRASQELADIQQGMAQAVAKQTRSERMKVELITNVSHDLKTPLTSIISYAELLKQEHLAPPAGEYAEILAQKAERLRSMVLDVFEVSKASSGDLPVKLETLDLAKLLRQTVADMQEAIAAAPVQLRQSLPEAPVPIVADGNRLYRVFQNLLQNALQYALEGSRVYLSLTVEDGKAVAAVKNTSKAELPEGVDFAARFVRGDQSRTDGGSGLGLAIAQSFTEACGGELRVEPVADLFVVTVTFPPAEGPCPPLPPEPLEGSKSGGEDPSPAE